MSTHILETLSCCGQSFIEEDQMAIRWKCGEKISLADIYVSFFFKFCCWYSYLLLQHTSFNYIALDAKRQS